MGSDTCPLSSSLDTDDSQVKDNGQEVTFVLIGRTDVSFTYEVTTSDTEPPPYTFSGQLSGVDGPDPVTGDDTVTLTRRRHWDRMRPLQSRAPPAPENHLR